MQWDFGKIADLLIWGQKTLGPKIWPQCPIGLENDCWGLGESIDTHIVGFCEKKILEHFCLENVRLFAFIYDAETPHWLRNYYLQDGN